MFDVFLNSKKQRSLIAMGRRVCKIEVDLNYELNIIIATDSQIFLCYFKRKENYLFHILPLSF